MSEAKITNAEFTIERTIAAPVARVYAAFADEEAKSRWFEGPEGNSTGEHVMDFRVGGNELNSGEFHGTLHTFKAHYYDILPEQRIVYTYEMYLGETRISVSLTSIELKAEGDKTHLVLHEAGAFFDEFDQPESREQGTVELLNALEKSVIS